jgi:1,4-alpha-glucan branching enzyme
MTQRTESPASLVHYDVSLLSEQDLYLFNEGSHYRMFDKLGAHVMDPGSGLGTCFSVWAPNAREVSVIGAFNQWNPKTHVL